MANQILNGSFERDTDYDGIPDSWTVENPASLSVSGQRDDPLTVVHGSASLRLSNAATLTGNAVTGLSQDAVPLAAPSGQTFRYSVYVYPTSLNGGAVELTIEHHSAAHAILATTTSTFLVAQIPLNVLTRIQVTGNVPASSHHAQARLRLKGQGGGQNAGQIVVFFDAAQYEADSVTYFAPAAADPPDVYRNGQYMLNDVVMNESQATHGTIVEQVEGLFDLPQIKVSGDYEDDANHGGFAGQERISRRIVTMDLAVHGASEADLHARLQAMRTALIPDSVDKTFWFKRVGIGGTDKKFAIARVRKVGGFDSDYEMASGWYARGAIQLLMADPALYDSFPQVRTDTLPASTTTVSFGVTPTGNFRTYPTFVITGPATNPGINQQVTINGVVRNRTIRLATTIPAGQSVTIDTKTRLVTHSSGADWTGFLDDSNQWWALVPGVVNTIALVANPNSTTWTSKMTYFPAWL